MAGITVHCMVRNEPFVSYAVKSVYPYVDKILLYDTGSDDAHTLQDIEKLCKEDKSKKIDFQRVPIEYDETAWDQDSFRQIAEVNTGKRGTWWVRQKMIDDTKTPFFMILDGDEVHYQYTMETLARLTNNWPKDKLCGWMSLLWFLDTQHIFNVTSSGRVFVTDGVSVTDYSPGEIHTIKTTGEKISRSSTISFPIQNVTPYAHFERLLKPWRRLVNPKRIELFKGQWPEVIENDTEILRRTLSEGPCKKPVS